ncbi:hypothetical protein B4123_4270 [Bacillus paralicheniformis]|uniref:hypothetical protein n=1 Tax=Bacillus TaxID=1386 RepID=UPI0007414955|nr:MULTISPECIES: hypothetical protein [Bacillus]KUL17468.1 hypothetical protein LI6934_11755 [Bacillus licheniformis LMG 6934]MBG9884879.1 hypothetical protein [Bacillus paralicheniformis]MDE1390973.1 hypothetical protein [Bacillus paralicheniformis]MED0805024.1 hypothetical protein [Bacillus paralicheniformis]OLG03017.1 hypothetical protein B4123_4270 [Bacillus paralicheniformis]
MNKRTCAFLYKKGMLVHSVPFFSEKKHPVPDAEQHVFLINQPHIRRNFLCRVSEKTKSKIVRKNLKAAKKGEDINVFCFMEAGLVF